MALAICRECSKTVSTSAAHCPHCGVSRPASKPGSKIANRMLIGAGFIVVLIVVFSRDESPTDGSVDTKTALSSADQAEKDAQCKKDLQCWGDKGSIGAGIFCKKEIEKLAKFSMKWTDAWYEPKFSRFRWSRSSPNTPGLVTFVGDKAQFQNGYGAFQNMIYTCDMIPDDKSNRIYDVTVTPGRLD